MKGAMRLGVLIGAVLLAGALTVTALAFGSSSLSLTPISAPIVSEHSSIPSPRDDSGTCGGVGDANDPGCAAAATPPGSGTTDRARSRARPTRAARVTGRTTRARGAPRTTDPHRLLPRKREPPGTGTPTGLGRIR
jgi:hypothetical protein